MHAGEETTCAQSMLDLSQNMGFVQMNLTQLPRLPHSAPRIASHDWMFPFPILCVELKPKSGGWITRTCADNTKAASACRYCMHQHLKLAKGKIAKVNGCVVMTVLFESIVVDRSSSLLQMRIQQFSCISCSIDLLSHFMFSVYVCTTITL
jgi:hypothetical protein